MSKLQIENVIKSYIVNEKNSKEDKNSFLLKIDNLNIEKGEFFGLIGASGCGKTTLLKIIAGLLEVDEGKIFIDNTDVTKVSAEKRNIAMVFQQPLLFPHMTIEQNVAFGLKMQKVNKKERSEKVKRALEAVGLKGFENRQPSELSGGQQQRAAIARAIVCQPQVLLMDEPFSALDPKLREEMRELISKIHKKYNITIVFVTHDKEEAFILFNRMAIIKEGEILQVGSPQELYENPSCTYIAEFLGSKNIFYGKVNKDIFISDELKFKLSNSKYDGCDGNLILRSESLEVKKLQEHCTNTFKASIKEASFRQGFLYLKVQVKSRTIEITQKAQVGADIEIGEEVLVEYDSRKITFIPE